MRETRSFVRPPRRMWSGDSDCGSPDHDVARDGETKRAAGRQACVALLAALRGNGACGGSRGCSDDGGLCRRAKDSPEHGAHFGCATCHGPQGQGGVTKYTITDYLGANRTVEWAAPAIDTALLKFSPDEVKTILTYGRANTPMPPWGVMGGGPMK